MIGKDKYEVTLREAYFAAYEVYNYLDTVERHHEWYEECRNASELMRRIKVEMKRAEYTMRNIKYMVDMVDEDCVDE